MLLTAMMFATPLTLFLFFLVSIEETQRIDTTPLPQKKSKRDLMKELYAIVFRRKS